MVVARDFSAFRGRAQVGGERHNGGMSEQQRIEPCNIAAALPRLARERPAHVAMRCPGRNGAYDVALSYAELDARSDAIAGGLAGRRAQGEQILLHRRMVAGQRQQRGARRGTAPVAAAAVVPEPENGSSTTSPRFEDDSRTRAMSASGFCVGWTLRPSLSLRRSEPVQIGRSQSERSCRSSLPAFMAS